MRASTNIRLAALLVWGVALLQAPTSVSSQHYKTVLGGSSGADAGLPTLELKLTCASCRRVLKLPYGSFRLTAGPFLLHLLQLMGLIYSKETPQQVDGRLCNMLCTADACPCLPPLMLIEK